MIIIGYPGIGKSTIVKKWDRAIDLESSNMWIPAHDIWDRTRWSNWSYVYAQIAEDLSKQGFVVFVSSHKDVQDRFIEGRMENVYICYPALELKDQWIERLRQRCSEDPSGKNDRALENVEKSYISQVSAIEQTPLKKIKITSIDYDLKSLIEGVM